MENPQDNIIELPMQMRGTEMDDLLTVKGLNTSTKVGILTGKILEYQILFRETGGSWKTEARWQDDFDALSFIGADPHARRELQQAVTDGKYKPLTDNDRNPRLLGRTFPSHRT